VGFLDGFGGDEKMTKKWAIAGFGGRKKHEKNSPKK
jgi:hypothetical protein